jgi:hypothetical protein
LFSWYFDNVGFDVPAEAWGTLYSIAWCSRALWSGVLILLFSMKEDMQLCSRALSAHDNMTPIRAKQHRKKYLTSQVTNELPLLPAVDGHIPILFSAAKTSEMAFAAGIDTTILPSGNPLLGCIGLLWKGAEVDFTENGHTCRIPNPQVNLLS